MTDRHYALFANNQHPIQLHCYEEYNQFLQAMHNAEGAQRDAQAAEQFDMECDARTKRLNTAEGESLSLDELQEIMFQVQGRAREQRNMALNTRTKTGEINDYLETRRPFGAGQ